MSSFPLQQPRRLATLVAVALLVAAVVSPATSQAQQLIASSSSAIPAEDSSLPDAPSHVLYPQSGQTAPPPQPIQTTNPDAVSPNGTQQTKRILGIMPNFRSVSADIKLPPQTSRQKFIAAGHDTFDYSSFFIAGIQAGFSMNGNSYPEFHQGAKGYARYYWHTLADTTTENFMVGGLGPVVFHQDNRYYTLGHGGFRKRTFYALTRVLISRKDDGDSTFNFAEVIGSGAAAGTSTLYYPTRYRTWTKVGQKWLTSDIIDGANFMLKEFWPDINKAIFHTH
ncbi:MAG: hypothetical protein JWQ42_146 [Edaphobacter sp.]|nr:hypothetical protein [Edaphobacter sp.]